MHAPRPRSVRIAAAGLAALCALAPAARAQEAHAGAAADAADAPAALALQDLAGAPASLESLRGDVVLLNFWATWCVPCRREMPLLQSLAERYAGRARFVAASADELGDRVKVEKDAQALGVRFPVWIGATTADMQRLGLGAELPATAILDRDGRVVSRLVGVVEERDVTRRLDWLLSERLTPQPWRTEPPAGSKRPRGAGAGGASLVPS